MSSNRSDRRHNTPARPSRLLQTVQPTWSVSLIICDEVHFLSALVFCTAADLQSRLRLRLTIPVRGDGRETDVLSLVKPPRYDEQWKDFEYRG